MERIGPVITRSDPHLDETSATASVFLDSLLETRLPTMEAGIMRRSPRKTQKIILKIGPFRSINVGCAIQKKIKDRQLWLRCKMRRSKQRDCMENWNFFQ